MPGAERKRTKPPPLATLVEQTQAELASTVEALRAHGTRLAGLRRHLRARIPAQKFALALATFEHTLPTALACGLDEQLAQIARLVAELEASVAATAADPYTRPRPEELVLVELLGRRDRFAAQLL